MRNILSLNWVFGPIFSKELRISSRHRTHYALRFAHLISLTIFIAVVWLGETQSIRYIQGNTLYIVSRMAQAGKVITVYIVWFQFCTVQLVAIALLSTSMSDEIYNRTLSILMTTPITRVQIIFGKLFSRLLQLILILALTLPLLAVVRVFGGVPWTYLISCFCITLTTVIFIGSVTMFVSMFFRHAYTVIIVTLIALGAVFGLSSLLIAIQRGWGGVFTGLLHLNPYMMLTLVTESMLDPRRAAQFVISWPIHCATMAAGSLIVLSISMFIVRPIALMQASSRTGLFKRLWRQSVAKIDKRSSNKTSRIRRVKGPPVVWKELVSRISSREKLIAGVIIAAQLAMIVAIHFFIIVASMVGYNEAHKWYVLIFLGIGIIFSAILPATCITSEKESQSWPLLLSTTLGNWQIVLGKLSGAMRRCLPVWILLFAYIVLFWYAKCLHGIVIIHIAIMVTGVLGFLFGTGLYFSSRFRRTSAAVIANLILIACLWLVIPVFAKLTGSIFGRTWEDICEVYQYTPPFTQASVVTDAAAQINSNWLDYDWPGGDSHAGKTICILLITMAANIFLGFLFTCAAARRLRRGIF